MFGSLGLKILKKVDHWNELDKSVLQETQKEALGKEAGKKWKKRSSRRSSKDGKKKRKSKKDGKKGSRSSKTPNPENKS